MLALGGKIFGANPKKFGAVGAVLENFGQIFEKALQKTLPDMEDISRVSRPISGHQSNSSEEFSCNCTPYPKKTEECRESPESGKNNSD